MLSHGGRVRLGSYYGQGQGGQHAGSEEVVRSGYVPTRSAVRSKRPHTFWHANCWTDSSSRHVLTSSVQPFRAIWKASYKSLQYFNVYVTFWHVPPSIRCCPSIISLHSDTFQLSSDTFYHAEHDIYMFLDTFWYVLCNSIAKTSKKKKFWPFPS